MSLLLTDTKLKVRYCENERDPPRMLDCPFASPYMPLITRELLLVCCRQQRDCLVMERRTQHPLRLMPAMPALTGLCVSRCGRYVYQLSAEADAVHTRYTATGELMYAALTGVFPRAMSLDPMDRTLLVAGGAVSEAYLLRAPELVREHVIPTRGACFAADFWAGGLVLACALEGEDIQTAVYTLAPHAARARRLITLPGQPGAMRVCPDGRAALLSTPDGLMKLDLHTGQLMWNLPEWPLCMRLDTKNGQALISDTLSGQCCLLRHDQPWLSRVVCAGEDAQAALA